MGFSCLTTVHSSLFQIKPNALQWLELSWELWLPSCSAVQCTLLHYFPSVCTSCPLHTLHTFYITNRSHCIHSILHIAHIAYIAHIVHCAVALSRAHWGALLSICLYFLYLALPEETTHQSSHPSTIDDCDEEISSVLAHEHQNLNKGDFLFKS